MAHYVKVVDGVVVNGIVAEPEFFNTFVDSSPGEWIKTSYNMRGGVYYDPTTNQPHPDQAGMIAADEARQRKNYAGIGYSYDRERNAFIPPKPFDSWVLNEDSCLWDPPVPYPTDDKMYRWDEPNQSWSEVTE